MNEAKARDPVAALRQRGHQRPGTQRCQAVVRGRPPGHMHSHSALQDQRSRLQPRRDRPGAQRWFPGYCDGAGLGAAGGGRAGATGSRPPGPAWAGWRLW